LRDLLHEIVAAFREQGSIAVVFGSDDHRRRIFPELLPTWVGGTLIRRDQLYADPPHVAVGRLRDFSGTDLGLHNFDLVIFVRATDALGELPQRMLAQPSVHCRLIGLLPANQHMTRYERGRLMATFGPSEFGVPEWGRIERPVHYVRLLAPDRRVRNGREIVQLLREAVWRNAVLNQFIAESAEAIASGRTSGLRLIPTMPDQSPTLGSTPDVTLVCDNVEHAAELARRLPDWSVHFGADSYLDGLRQPGLRALERSRENSAWIGQHKRIMTVDGLRTLEVNRADVLIWVGTSGDLPAIPQRSLLVNTINPSETRPLLLVDLMDRAHPELHRRSQEREWHCLHRGWIPVDTSLEVVRSIAFDDEVSGHGDALAVARRAQHRHFVGEALPRMVHAARWYPQFAERQPTSADVAPVLPPLSQVVHPENLIETYRRMRDTKGPGAGVDGLSYRDLSSSEICTLLRWTSRSIGQHQYRPHPTKLVRIRKRSGGWRELRIPTIVDRVVTTAITDALTPVLDQNFLDSSYGFRPGKSREMMLAQIMHDMVTQSRYVLGLEDVRDAFSSIRLDRVLCRLTTVLQAVQERQGQPQLAEEWLRLLAVIVRGSYRTDRDCGLDQGNALSPLLLGLDLDVVLDRPLLAAAPDGTPSYRYADNTGVLCSDVRECRRILDLMRSLLQPNGLDLKGWDPLNLARPGTEAEILGLSLRLHDGTPQLHIGNSSFDDLTDDLADCYEAEDPGRTAILLLRGWLDAMGPAFEFCDGEWVLDRLYRTAALLGFRELGPRRDLRATMEQSRIRWLEVRSRIGQNAGPVQSGVATGNTL